MSLLEGIPLEATVASGSRKRHVLWMFPFFNRWEAIHRRNAFLFISSSQQVSIHPTHAVVEERRAFPCRSVHAPSRTAFRQLALRQLRISLSSFSSLSSFFFVCQEGTYLHTYQPPPVQSPPPHLRMWIFSCSMPPASNPQLWHLKGPFRS